MLDEVTLVHRNGSTRRVPVIRTDLGAHPPVIEIRFGFAGVFIANLTHGWLDSGDWRISEGDLDTLRALALDAGHVIWSMPRSPGRPRKPRAPAAVPAKQTRFDGGGW